MLSFNLYNDRNFRELLSWVYDFSEKKVEGINFFYSNKFFRKKELFLNTLGFFDLNFFEYNIWNNLTDFSIENRVNIRVCSLKDSNFTEKKRIVSYCPILSLPSSPDLLSDLFSTNLKSNIKKLQNKITSENIYLEKVSSVKDLKSFYINIFAREYVKKHKMLFQPYRLFEDLIFKYGFADLVVAKVNGNIIGGIIISKDDETIHYNWGAFPRYKNLPIGLFLILETIKEGINNHFKYYDFGGTPVSDHDLLSFKKKFGATVYPVYEYNTLSQASLIDLNSDFSWERKLFSLLNPEFAAKAMPFVVPWVIR